MPAGRSDRELLPHPRSAVPLVTITEGLTPQGANPKHPFQIRSIRVPILTYRINIHFTIDAAAKSDTFR
jgi:hypothetical protein